MPRPWWADCCTPCQAPVPRSAPSARGTPSTRPASSRTFREWNRTSGWGAGSQLGILSHARTHCETQHASSWQIYSDLCRILSTSNLSEMKPWGWFTYSSRRPLGLSPCVSVSAAASFLNLVTCIAVTNDSYSASDGQMCRILKILIFVGNSNYLLS